MAARAIASSVALVKSTRVARAEHQMPERRRGPRTVLRRARPERVIERLSERIAALAHILVVHQFNMNIDQHSGSHSFTTEKMGIPS